WLVKTKKVLNQKTRFHTPTVWLLVLPALVIIGGYAWFITSAVLASNSADTGTSTTRTYGEVVNKQGEKRPPQYTHVCDTADGTEYITQGAPPCLGRDTYKGDYAPSVAGTIYSSPCKTDGTPSRYVYIATSENCPGGSTLVFYNNIAVNGSLWALGLIIVGSIAAFGLSLFWFFRFSKAVNEYTHGKMSTAVSFLILWLIHLIGVALIQDTFNDMQDGIVAGQPAAPAPNQEHLDFSQAAQPEKHDDTEKDKTES
ncbi:MAG TPA: hypothetical protein VN554_01025, partial [Verrucomicrobiae bacterium]|nr:hypothetical protein [Verrucomicrobiae bacterium]